MDAKTRDELKRLEAKATPGEWLWCHAPDRTDKASFLAWCAEAWDLTIRANGSREEEGIQYVGRMLPAGEKEWSEDEYVCVSITGNGPTSAANARFIPALRNHAKELLADSERLAEVEAKCEGMRRLLVQVYDCAATCNPKLTHDIHLAIRPEKHHEKCEFCCSAALQNGHADDCELAAALTADKEERDAHQ